MSKQPSPQHELRVAFLPSGALSFPLAGTASQLPLAPTRNEERVRMLTLGNPVSPFHPSWVGRGFTVHGHFLPEALVNVDCAEKGHRLGQVIETQLGGEHTPERDPVCSQSRPAAREGPLTSLGEMPAVLRGST